MKKSTRKNSPRDVKQGAFVFQNWRRRLCFALMSILLSACAMVQPWEREYLADPIMQEEFAAEAAYEQHLHRALSQGLVGQPVEGGGCGCEQ